MPVTWAWLLVWADAFKFREYCRWPWADCEVTLSESWPLVWAVAFKNKAYLFWPWAACERTVTISIRCIWIQSIFPESERTLSGGMNRCRFREYFPWPWADGEVTLSEPWLVVWGAFKYKECVPWASAGLDLTVIWTRGDRERIVNDFSLNQVQALQPKWLESIQCRGDL